MHAYMHTYIHIYREEHCLKAGTYRQSDRQAGRNTYIIHTYMQPGIQAGMHTHTYIHTYVHTDNTGHAYV